MHTSNGCLVDPWRQHRQRPPYTLPEQRPAAARACRSPSSGAPSRSVRAAASCSAEAWPQAGTAAGRPFSLNRAAQRVANLCSWRREWPRPAAAGCVCCCDGTIFPGILYLSLSNKVFAALPVDIQPSFPPSLMSAPPRSPCRRLRSEYNTFCRQRAPLLHPGFGIWTQTNYTPPRSSSQPGNGMELSDGQTVSGAVLSTW